MLPFADSQSYVIGLHREIRASGPVRIFIFKSAAGLKQLVISITYPHKASEEGYSALSGWLEYFQLATRMPDSF
jgi:hypothetical protein